jgi:glutamate dehydrogenase
MGGEIACVACWNQADRTAYAFRKKGGIDFKNWLPSPTRLARSTKPKPKALGYERLPGEAWIEQDVDILVPAALEYQIRPDNVERISRQVKIIAEGANGPTDPDVDPRFKRARIMVIPDILANAGG